MARSTAQVQLTVGASGHGKTYVRAAHAIPEYISEVRPLPGKEEEQPCMHISNFPLRLDDWEREDGTTAQGMISFIRDRYGIDEEEVRRRVVVIPPEEIAKWMTRKSGPWETFAGVNLSGCHIAIDEIHNFCPSVGASLDHQRKWAAWLGEIRHCGATVELLTQNLAKVSKLIVHEASIMFYVYNSEIEREPIFGCLLGDWYELWAKFISGKYPALVYEIEKTQVDGKWKEQQSRSFFLERERFDLYNSYSAPHAGGVAGRSVERAFKRFSRLGLVAWFLKRNWPNLSWRLGFAGLLVWMLFFDGSKALSGVAGWLIDFDVPALVASEGQGTARPGSSAAAGGGQELALKLSMELDALEEKLAAKEAELSEALERAGELEHQLRAATEVQLVTRDRVTLRNGETYHVGDVIDLGPFAGQTVESIDWQRRRVVLSGGDVLRLVPGQSSWLQSAKEVVAGRAANPVRSGVSGTVRGAAGGSADVDERAGGSETGDDQLPGHAADPVRPVAEQRDGNLDRR